MDALFIFKVALEGSKDCWRRIAIRGDQTLDDLHEAIYEAFDREDEHLYSFFFPKAGSKGRNRLRDAKEYTHPEGVGSGPLGDLFGDKPTPSAAKARIGKLGLTPKQTFLYLFDFGDEWWHEITVEQTDGTPDKGKYPRIIEKHGTSPAQYPDYDADEEEEEDEEEKE